MESDQVIKRSRARDSENFIRKRGAYIQRVCVYAEIREQTGRVENWRI